MKLATTRALRYETHFGQRRMLCYSQRPKSLLELFEKAIQNGAQTIALIDERAQLSYHELDRQSQQVAKYFTQLGLKAGDRLVLLTGNCLEFGVVALAAWRIGVIIAPLNPRNVGDEVAFVLNQCAAKALIYEAWLADRKPGNGVAPACEHVLEVRELISAATTPAASTPAATPHAALVNPETPFAGYPPDEESVAVLLYTSGTTGRPKGAMLTHLNIVHSVLHFVDQMQLRQGEERSLLAVPISHVTGMVAIWLSMVAVAGTTAMLREFKSAPFLQLMVEHRVTHTLVVPAIYNLLLRDPNFAQYDLNHWRIGGYGGAPMPEPTIAALAQSLPKLGLMNAYGSTETSSPATLMPASEQRANLDSVGRVMPCAVIKIMDDDGREVPPGQSGELWIAGPMVVPGYWDNPQASEKEFIDGYWKSGDIGSIDANGYVRVFDRKKDMINRGGYKVYSAEVESVLAAHEAVLEAAVFAQPDPVLGERSRAVVVLKPDTNVAAELLRAHCAARLADYKVPDFFQLSYDALPRNPNGKVMKRALREH